MIHSDAWCESADTHSCYSRPCFLQEIDMPFHLVPQSRRGFLKTTLAGGAAMLAASSSKAADGESVSSRWALVADTHIAGDPKTRARGATMFDNLGRIVTEILAEEVRPEGVIIDGDCAYLKGLPDDYKTLSKALQPLVAAKMPVHMTMGNHDDRVEFRKAFAEQRQEAPLVEGKHVTVLESAAANLFLVDSLQKVNVVTGELGQTQLAWLAKALDAHADKPAFVIGHHNLQFVAAGSTARITGLADSLALVATLQDRAHVQGYVFGHSHNWNLQQTESGLHLINLPPSAYVFSAGKPNGWVRATFAADHCTLELRALDQSHAQHGQLRKLSYRKETAAPS